jgi:hypothetical protein
MTAASAQRALFFSSIPKCGKNLIYSFYKALGHERVSWGDEPAIVHRAGFAHFPDVPTYAFAEHLPVAPHEEELALTDVLAKLASLAPDAITHGHFLPHPRLTAFLADAALSSLFVYRHPRDALLSMLNYARVQSLPVHVATLLRDLDDEQALLLLLRGEGKIVPFADYFDAYRPWLSALSVTAVRFEDLIGPDGGGDAAAQARACVKLAAAVGVAPGDPRVEAGRARVFNRRAGTFFRGRIGAWQEAFSNRVGECYDACAGHLDRAWGYDA